MEYDALREDDSFSKDKSEQLLLVRGWVSFYCIRKIERKMNKRNLVVALLFIALVLLRMSTARSEGFVGEEGGMKLVIAKADWCGHCRKAAPEFARLKEASPLVLGNGKKVIVEELDADKNKSEIAALDVKGFPTLMVQKGGGEKVEYPGERTYDAVMSFLEQQ